MPIRYRLCPLSPKRLAFLEADPELAFELDEESVPELLDLGTDGFELAGILMFAGKDAVRDAVFAQSGRCLGEDSDGIRVHSSKRVKEVARALNALPDDVIATHYEAARRAMAGKLDPSAVGRFTDLFEQLREAYVAAASVDQGMLTYMT